MTGTDAAGLLMGERLPRMSVSTTSANSLAYCLNRRAAGCSCPLGEAPRSALREIDRKSSYERSFLIGLDDGLDKPHLERLLSGQVEVALRAFVKFVAGDVTTSRELGEAVFLDPLGGLRQFELL
jgi:hypothetical protein